MNREYPATITSTGNDAVVPSSSGIRVGGNHKSHWAASPAAHNSRSAGSGRRRSGRRRATFSRNHDDGPDQPTRSASTVASISGNSPSKARSRSSNGVNDVVSAAAAHTWAARHMPRHERPWLRGIPNRSAWWLARRQDAGDGRRPLGANAAASLQEAIRPAIKTGLGNARGLLPPHRSGRARGR